MTRKERRSGGRPGLLPWALVVAVVGLGGCDFDVTNPGPVQDDFLDDEAAHQAIVNGAARQFANGLNETAYTTAAIAREFFPGGSTGSFGISTKQQQGILAYDDEHVEWDAQQEARWIAETGYERFVRVLGEAEANAYGPSAEAALWAGYANRLLGENWCQGADTTGVFPSTVYLEDAQEWFTLANQIATTVGDETVATAAVAGRASVRAFLGDWAGAVADAQQVPTDFVFQAGYNELTQDQYNRINWGSASEPYRAHTVWNTVYETYYEETGDPRVPWARSSDPNQQTGDAEVLDLGLVPFLRQMKHDERGSDIDLSSGEEMRLIEAEALLLDGQWEQAVAILNDLRDRAGVDPWVVGSEAEAWTAFKRERGIELWLEGRRMGDLRRWEENGTPGELDPLEQPGEQSRLSQNRTLCYDIPRAERITNPAVPDQP